MTLLASDEEFLAEAAAIGDRLAAEAVHHADRCTWVARVPRVAGQARPPAPTAANLDASVFTGTAGVALFLARLARFTGERAHRATALAGMRHAMLHAWETREEPTLLTGTAWRFSAYGGTLGVAWAAVEAERLLGDEPLGAQGRRAVRRLAAEDGAPHEHDVVLGAAGGLPALLDLDRSGAPGTWDLAIELGDRLVAAAEAQGDARSWPSPALAGPRATRLLGLSHGAAGIGWSLAVLHDASGDPRFAEAAEGAWRYERRHFDARERNWPHFQEPAGPDGRHPCWSTWCHGAPGIGLTRAAAPPAVRGKEAREELHVARATTAGALRQRLELPGSNFMPCCGVAGVAECLWLMEEALGIEGALERQRAIGRYGIERFGQAAREKWGPTIEWPTGVPWGVYPPLMKGLAGIGHYLLRLHAPEKVPTVLLPGLPMRA